MALPATLVWEVRPTNGTTNAGGGFDPSVASPGTDFSQQNGVQQSYTDLVIDAVTNTDITSVARPFSSTDIGNNIAITGGSGFTTGIYNIRSIQSAIIARLDRAVGTTGSTAGTAGYGGARSGFTGGTTTMQSALVAGNTIHVKNEAWNEAVSCANNGSAGNPITILGYNTARNDNPTGANRPTNDRASGAANAFSIAGTNYIVKNIVGRRGTSNGWTALTSGIFINCKADTNGASGFTVAATSIFVGCESNNNTTTGFGGAFGQQHIGCYVHDNTTAGVVALATLRAFYSIYESNSSHGIGDAVSTLGAAVINCTIYGNTGAAVDGINLTTPVAGTIVYNTILANNGRYGINATDGDSLLSDFNDFFSNSTAARNNVPVGGSDVTSDPTFTDAANGNFTIGTNLKGLGFPGLFPASLCTGYPDIGAVQRQETASGTTIAGTTICRGMVS